MGFREFQDRRVGSAGRFFGNSQSSQGKLASLDSQGMSAQTPRLSALNSNEESQKVRGAIGVSLAGAVERLSSFQVDRGKIGPESKSLGDQDGTPHRVDDDAVSEIRGDCSVASRSSSNFTHRAFELPLGEILKEPSGGTPVPDAGAAEGDEASNQRYSSLTNSLNASVDLSNLVSATSRDHTTQDDRIGSKSPSSDSLTIPSLPMAAFSGGDYQRTIAQASDQFGPRGATLDSSEQPVRSFQPGSFIPPSIFAASDRFGSIGNIAENGDKFDDLTSAGVDPSLSSMIANQFFLPPGSRDARANDSIGLLEGSANPLMGSDFNSRSDAFAIPSSSVSQGQNGGSDLAKTNELLQQLIEEVRRGRQGFLPIADRNASF